MPNAPRGGRADARVSVLSKRVVLMPAAFCPDDEQRRTACHSETPPRFFGMSAAPTRRSGRFSASVMRRAASRALGSWRASLGIGKLSAEMLLEHRALTDHRLNGSGRDHGEA